MSLSDFDYPHRSCAICGSTHNIESHHIHSRGMGGRGKKAPRDAELRIDLCAGDGAGSLDRTSCHGAVHNGDLQIEHSRGVTRFRTLSRALAARGVPADGEWHYTRGEAYLP